MQLQRDKDAPLIGGSMDQEEVELDEVATTPAVPGNPLSVSAPEYTKDKARPDATDDSRTEALDDLEGVGIVLSDEPIDSKSSASKSETFKKFFLPTKGKELSYGFGIAFDLFLFASWLTLIFTVLDDHQKRAAWYMPLLGVCGATVAMATPAGGGVFYFPALTALQVPPKLAIAFNFATQVTGMGLFGTFHWVRKSLSNIVLWLVAYAVFWGWVGASISLYAVPIKDDLALRVIFAVFSFILLCYVIYGLKKGTLKSQDEPVPRNWKSLIVFAVSGLLGGVMLGWISVGIDTVIFFVLTAIYKVDSRKATVTSILVIGWTSLLPLLAHIFDPNRSVPYVLWLMVTGGSIIGARLGPLINKLVGRKVMLIAFVVLLALEVVRTIIELAVVPFIFPDAPPPPANATVSASP